VRHFFTWRDTNISIFVSIYLNFNLNLKLENTIDNFRSKKIQYDMNTIRYDMYQHDV